MGNRSKYLIKNTIIFAIGNISTQLIRFLLVPLYTYSLSTAEYGTIDKITSICSMIIPLLMCNIGEAIRRYLLDENRDTNSVRAVQFIWNLIGLAISVLVYFVVLCIPSLRIYAPLICCFCFFNALSQTFLEFLRGKEFLKRYTLCSILSTLGVAILNIIFIVNFHWGVEGYFLAFILSYGFTACLAFIFGGQYKKIGSLRLNKKLFKEMSLFSFTLVPNSLMWWVINSSDRIMVSYLISSSANGIYSVSYKLPSLLSTLSTILMQAWQYSAIKESNSKDSSEYQNLMFKFYLATTSIISAGLLIILNPFMSIYVAPDYYEAWKYCPLLIIGLMFQTLGTFVGTNYYVHKDMKGNLLSSTVGAIINVVLNFLLIPLIGIQGAAIATCISYIAVFVYRLIDTRKYLKLNFNNAYSWLMIALVAIMVMCKYMPVIISYSLMFVCFILIVILNKSFIKSILGALVNKAAMIRKRKT